MKVTPFNALVPARFFLGGLLLALLAGCTNSPRWGSWSKRPTEAQIAAALGQPAAAPLQTYAAR